MLFRNGPMPLCQYISQPINMILHSYILRIIGEVIPPHSIPNVQDGIHGYIHFEGKQLMPGLPTCCNQPTFKFDRSTVPSENPYTATIMMPGSPPPVEQPPLLSHSKDPFLPQLEPCLCP